VNTLKVISFDATHYSVIWGVMETLDILNSEPWWVYTINFKNLPSARTRSCLIFIDLRKYTPFFPFRTLEIQVAQLVNGKMVLIISYFFFFWDRIWLCSPGWLWIHNPPWASQLLGLQVWVMQIYSMLFI
jgi:hypothetical protein